LTAEAHCRAGRHETGLAAPCAVPWGRLAGPGPDQITAAAAQLRLNRVMQWQTSGWVSALRPPRAICPAAMPPGQGRVIRNRVDAMIGWPRIAPGGGILSNEIPAPRALLDRGDSARTGETRNRSADARLLWLSPSAGHHGPTARHWRGRPLHSASYTARPRPEIILRYLCRYAAGLFDNERKCYESRRVLLAPTTWLLPTDYVPDARRPHMHI